ASCFHAIVRISQDSGSGLTLSGRAGAAPALNSTRVPPAPTANAEAAMGAVIPFKSKSVPDASISQDAPLSSLRATSPPSPTAKAEVPATASPRIGLVRLATTVQVRPPFWVR